jgi:hypothetical protein
VLGSSVDRDGALEDDFLGLDVDGIFLVATSFEGERFAASAPATDGSFRDESDDTPCAGRRVATGESPAFVWDPGERAG